MFGDNLKKIRSERGISQKALAKMIFMSQQAVAKWETNAASPNPETIGRIAEALGVDPSVLVYTGQKPKQGRVPVLGDVAAGIPIEAITDIIDYEEVDEHLSSLGELFGLRIRGDSMEPRIREGDVVIVLQTETCTTGDVCVVMVNGDAATVKRVRLEEEGLWLIANNPAYAPRFFTKKEISEKPVRIIGKVVELRGKSF